jgi:hypothetical protein
VSGVRQLNVQAVAGIWPRMRIQTLIATLIALAMALAPLAAPGAAAAAAPAAGHHAQMMDSGHCDERQPGEHDKGALDQCCVATCAAAALNAPPALDFALAATAVPLPSPEPFGRGYLADLPTPPPRRA